VLPGPTSRLTRSSQVCDIAGDEIRKPDRVELADPVAVVEPVDCPERVPAYRRVVPCLAEHLRGRLQDAGLAIVIVVGDRAEPLLAAAAFGDRLVELAEPRVCVVELVLLLFADAAARVPFAEREYLLARVVAQALQLVDVELVEVFSVHGRASYSGPRTARTHRQAEADVLLRLAEWCGSVLRLRRLPRGPIRGF
jgi:hypothetical protein